MKESNELGMRCIKYMLLTITFMFVLTSALVIAVGTTVYAMYHDLSFLLETRYFSPASMVIVVGFFMMFVSLFGAVGALKESTCLVNVFALLLSVVFVLEVAAAIAAYRIKHGVEDLMDYELSAALDRYAEDEEVRTAFDYVQSGLNCCGVNAYTDWRDVSGVNSGLSAFNMTVPNSCCASTQITSIDGVETEVCYEIYANGCLPRIVFIIKQSSALLATGAFTIAFIQLIGIVFAVLMAKSIRQAKTEREMRRWKIVEDMINSSYARVPPSDEKKPETLLFVPN